MIRSNRISVVDKLAFLGKISAEQQLRWYEAYESVLKEFDQHVIANNDLLKQNGQLREMMNQMKASDEVQDMHIAINLLKSAKEEIITLKEMQKTSSARLGMFDDVMALLKSGRREHAYTEIPLPVESRIENFLNSIHE